MNQKFSYPSKAEIISNLLARDFSPTGNLEDPVWKTADRVVFDHDWIGENHYPECTTQVASLWTPSNFYFAFWCRYTDLNVYTGEDRAIERYSLWDRDVVEVFLNPCPGQLNQYFEFEVAPNGQWVDLEIDLRKELFYDHNWNSSFQHATRIDTVARTWTCEMKIPAASVHIPVIRPGWECRVNFYRLDGFGDDTERRQLAWSPTYSANPAAWFHAPTHFGKIRFESLPSLQRQHDDEFTLTPVER